MCKAGHMISAHVFMTLSGLQSVVICFMSTPTEECTWFLDFVTLKNICNCSYLICKENTCSKFYVIMHCKFVNLLVDIFIYLINMTIIYIYFDTRGFNSKSFCRIS